MTDIKELIHIRDVLDNLISGYEQHSVKSTVDLLRLQLIRDRRTLGELAKLIGVHHNTLSGFRNHGSGSIGTVIKIEEFYKDK